MRVHEQSVRPVPEPTVLEEAMRSPRKPVPTGGTWFPEKGTRTFTSHDGSAVERRDLGTVDAYLAAHSEGYRRLQIDVVALKDTFVSMHSLVGGFLVRNKTLCDLRKERPNVATLEELLTHSDLEGVWWNLEFKSARGVDRLIRLLGELDERGLDLSRILLSSPFRPKLLKEVAKNFSQISFAAPVVHGGALGIRFGTSRLAKVAPQRPYDCEQILRWFLRKQRRRHPVLRQAWTVTSHRKLRRTLEIGVDHCIVDSRKLKMARSNREVGAPSHLPAVSDVRVLALGGGGWRGAFGSIGAIQYLVREGAWPSIREVIGVSGGSFVVGRLASTGDEEPDPTKVLNDLLGSLLRIASKASSVFVLFGAVALLVAGAIVFALRAWSEGEVLRFLLLAVMVLLGSMALRLVASLRVHGLVRLIVRKSPFRTVPAGGAAGEPKRYVVGATGLHDGNLYAMTTDADREIEAWRMDRTRPVPLGAVESGWAVVRSTSLPGLGQMGIGRILLPTSGRHEKVPDRLVDGGLSGILGRGLIQAAEYVADDEGPPLVLAVDAGRSLPQNSAWLLRNRAWRLGERLSSLVLLARWLQIAFERSNRDQLASVRDGNEVDGHVYTLVRLAEPERNSGPQGGPSGKRGQDIERLRVVQEVVHRFSLMRASEGNADRTITAAVAACALEFEAEPDIEKTLEQVGNDLGRGDRLLTVWRNVPLLRE